jgi:ubiquinone/menaquinone biosynthesis C-methylase UbiE
VIPSVGELVAGDRQSYQYLVESIRRFPKQVKIGISKHFMLPSCLFSYILECTFVSKNFGVVLCVKPVEYIRKIQTSSLLSISADQTALTLQEKFAQMIQEAGFERVEYENLVGGVVAIHSGLKL